MVDLNLDDINGLSQGRTVVLVFTAEWLGAAHLLDTILEDLATTYDSSYQFIRLDADKNSEAAKKMNVEEVPTTFIIKDAEVKEKFVGVMSKHRIRDLIDSLN